MIFFAFLRFLIVIFYKLCFGIMCASTKVGRQWRTCSEILLIVDFVVTKEDRFDDIP